MAKKTTTKVAKAVETEEIVDVAELTKNNTSPEVDETTVPAEVKEDVPAVAVEEEKEPVNIETPVVDAETEKVEYVTESTIPGMKLYTTVIDGETVNIPLYEADYNNLDYILNKTHVQDKLAYLWPNLRRVLLVNKSVKDSDISAVYVKGMAGKSAEILLALKRCGGHIDYRSPKTFDDANSLYYISRIQNNAIRRASKDYTTACGMIEYYNVVNSLSEITI